MTKPISEMTNEQVVTVALACTELETKAMYGKELLRRLGSGEPPQPRCPKCGGKMNEQCVLTLKCDECKELFPVNKLSDFAQFFGPSAPQPQPPLFAMKPLQEQVEICEQNGTKWAHFKVSEIRELLSPSAPSGSAGQEPRCVSTFHDLQCERGYHEKGDHYARKDGTLINWVQYPAAAQPVAAKEWKSAKERGPFASNAGWEPVASPPGQTVGPDYTELASVTSATEKPTVSAMPTWANPKVEDIARRIWDEANDSADVLAILRPFFTQVSQPPTEGK